jgi:hypothetical protein
MRHDSDITTYVINMVLLASSVFNFLFAIALGTWVKTDTPGHKMINYALFFLLSSVFYHIHQIREHVSQCVYAGTGQSRFKSSDVWGALRDCSLPLILLPLGTPATTTYFSLVCWIAIGGCGRKDVKDTKPVTCVLIGIRFATWAFQKQSVVLGLCAIMFSGVCTTSLSVSKNRIMGIWMYPALAVVPLAASRMG